MKRWYWGSTALLVVLWVVIAGVLVRRRSIPGSPSKLEGASLLAFTSLEPIDAHTHIFQNSSDLIAMLERLHLHVMDILYVDDTNSYLKSIEPQKSDALQFVASSKGRAQLCTTFDPFRFNDTHFASLAISGLNQDFAAGAVAAKVWKNVGMEIVDRSGQYVMPDDQRFEPIYQDIARQGKTLVIHAADPDEAWGLRSPGGFVSTYFESNPQWNIANKPGAPEKRTILQASDHLLVLNPGLRVVGAHLGSMESHLDELARRLDLYPNFAVDTAARVRRLFFQPREQVRAFISQYQDRILYGTDLSFYSGASGRSAARSWESQYALEWRYFATDEVFDYQGHTVQGLNLPRSILKKLYHDNAVHWIPGIERGVERVASGSS